MANLAQIYDWFMTGKKPTQAQFWASWGSFWNKEETIPQSAISNLSTVLNAKTENDQFNAHKVAVDAHTDLFLGKEDKTQKGVAGGYVPLDEFSKIAHQFLSIVNNLTTGGTTSLLSAEQGVVLQTQIDAINTILTSDDINLDTIQELVDAIKTVETSFQTILINDLTTGGITKALTAEMGKVLKTLIDNLATEKSNSVTDIESTIKYPTWNSVSNWALGLFKKKYLQIETVSGITYTFGEEAVNTMFTFTNNNPITATIPTNVAQPFAIGTVFETIPLGAGVLTVEAEVGVVILSNLLKFSVNGEVRRYTKIDDDTWTIEGNIKNTTPTLQDVFDVTQPGIVVRGNNDLRLGTLLYYTIYGTGGVAIYDDSANTRTHYTPTSIQVVNSANTLIIQYPYWFSGTVVKVMPISVNNNFADGTGNISLSDASGTFTSADGKTITVTNGVIESII